MSIAQWVSLKGGTGVAPVNYAQDARATINGNGNGDKARAEVPSFDRRASTEHFSLVSPAPERDIAGEYSRFLSEPPALSGGSRFDRSDSTLNPPANAGGTDRFGRGNNGQSL